jgi:SAM-dependent methyltransferase
LVTSVTIPVCRWCGEPLTDGESLPGRVRCARCGVATTEPWPAAAELDRAYAAAYRPGAGRFAGIGDRLLRRTRGSLAGRIDRIAPPGPVLDVGAGDGALIEALRRHGREAVGTEREGTEIDPETSPAERETAGDEAVDEGSLPSAQGGWAAIVFWHSLEHLPDAAGALASAAAELAPGGVVIVAVPNSDSFQARAFGARWLALDPPRHLFHLSAVALRARLVELGLRVERVSYWRGGQVVFGWLDGMVGAPPPHLSLYDAIRRPQARFAPLDPGGRAAALLLAVLLSPAALVASAGEVAARRGGSVYVEARAPR